MNTEATDGALSRITYRRARLSELHQDPSNARRHDARNLDAIAGSLRTFAATGFGEDDLSELLDRLACRYWIAASMIFSRRDLISPAWPGSASWRRPFSSVKPRISATVQPPAATLSTRLGRN
jgi:hypothetical protein